MVLAGQPIRQRLINGRGVELRIRTHRSLGLRDRPRWNLVALDRLDQQNVPAILPDRAVVHGCPRRDEVAELLVYPLLLFRSPDHARVLGQWIDALEESPAPILECQRERG